MHDGVQLFVSASNDEYGGKRKMERRGKDFVCLRFFCLSSSFGRCSHCWNFGLLIFVAEEAMTDRQNPEKE